MSDTLNKETKRILTRSGKVRKLFSIIESIDRTITLINEVKEPALEPMKVKLTEYKQLIKEALERSIS